MNERVLWAIGSPDGRSEQLVDNYRDPNRVGEVVWRVPDDSTGTEQRWPLFHPSEADPEGGYRLHPYTIRFSLPREPQNGYVFRIHYLTIAPRLAHLQMSVNGVMGWVYLRPTAPKDQEIRVPDGLGTSIYAEGTAEVCIPADLLHQGENSLVLTAHDGGEMIMATSADKKARLDRLATGAGIIYQALTLSQVAMEPIMPIVRCDLQPSILYYQNADGELVERVDVYLEMAGAFQGAELSLRLCGEQESDCACLTIPPVPFGHWHQAVEMCDGSGPVTYELFGEIEGKAFRHTGTAQRRRKWKVYVSSHIHTDIGYTHRQWEVAERLARNIDAAIDLTQADGDTGTNPAFAYHLDASWALDTYRSTRKVRRQAQLMVAITDGRIKIPANYVDLLTQFAGLEDLIRNGQFTDSVLSQLDLRADFATAVDVASLSGSLPAILEGSGVKYLVHANNQGRGPFRLFNNLHLSSPFYWEGVNGGRVLTWLAKMYCELRKVCGSPPVLASAERGLDIWLEEYEHAGYAPDAILLYGQEADNTDLDPQPIDFIRQWNATYTYPCLIPCGISEFFQYVESQFGDRLKTVKGDEGAYWEDGVGSSIVPTIEVREAQGMLPAAERLETLAVLHHPDWAFPQEQYDAAWRSILLYDEHTWGAYLSGRDPEALLQRDQWAVKQGMAEDARAWSRRLLLSAASRHSLSWNTDGREVVVFNPHSWPVGGRVTVEIGPNERVLDPRTGDEIPTRLVKRLNTQSIVELWIEPVEGLSYRRLRLVTVGRRTEDGSETDDGPITNSEPRIAHHVLQLENSHYRLTIDLERGCATSWFDKVLERELILSGEGYGLGQFIYARGGKKTWLEDYRPDWPVGDPEVVTQFELIDHALEQHALGTTLTVRGRVPEGELEIAWTLPTHARQIDLRYTYLKNATLRKEAAYVAFPLDLPGAQVSSDSQLGWVNWNRDEVNGGCKEWLPLQTGILVEGDGASAFIASPDIPLLTVGDIVRGRWPRTLNLSGGKIFSYVLNNYWNTNYKASQGGTISFRYILTSDTEIEKERAYKLGWEARRPLYVQRISLQEFRTVDPPYARAEGGTLAQVEPSSVVLTALKKARWAEGYVLRLQEIAGADQTATIAFPGHPISHAWQTDLLEREQSEIPVDPDGCLRVAVTAWGLQTVRVALDE